MKMLAALALGLLVATATAEEKKAEFDATKLTGDWTYVSGMKSGEAVSKESLSPKVTISKDTFTVPAGPDMKFAITYTINSKVSPVQIDFTIKEAPAKEAVGTKAEGIISLEGDTLKLCYVDASAKDRAKRPEKFESTKENKAHFFVLKRAK
jgi:uncharacterized protein (TIGR03067 family)